MTSALTKGRAYARPPVAQDLIRPSQKGKSKGKSKKIWANLKKYAESASCEVVVMVSYANGKTSVNATDSFAPYVNDWLPEQVRRQASGIALKNTDQHRVNEDLVSAAEDTYGEEQDEDEWDDANVKHESSLQFPIPAVRSTPAPNRFRRSKATKRSASDRDNKSPKKKKAAVKQESSESDSECNEPASYEVREKISFRIGEEETVTQYYLTRFRQMQQLMCKVVAKAWIKVIEVKKQSNHPYNKGDLSKPPWWPPHIQHREPDHLKKHERMGLLLALLRCERTTIKALEAATADVMVQIPPERIPILEDIYRLAKMEERFRNQELPPDTHVFVPALETFHVRNHQKKSPLKVKNERRRPSKVETLPAVRSSTEEDGSLGPSTHNSPQMVFSPAAESADAVRSPAVPVTPGSSTLPNNSSQLHHPFISEQAPIQPLDDEMDYEAEFSQQLPVQAPPAGNQQHAYLDHSLPVNESNFYMMEQPPPPQRHSVSFAPSNESMPRTKFRRTQTMPAGMPLSQPYTPWQSLAESPIAGDMFSSYNPNTPPTPDRSQSLQGGADELQRHEPRYINIHMNTQMSMQSPPRPELGYTAFLQNEIETPGHVPGQDVQDGSSNVK